jgi:hypothetical protein
MEAIATRPAFPTVKVPARDKEQAVKLPGAPQKRRCDGHSGAGEAATACGPFGSNGMETMYQRPASIATGVMVFAHTKSAKQSRFWGSPMQTCGAVDANLLDIFSVSVDAGVVPGASMP